jgi:hypothetical protein
VGTFSTTDPDDTNGTEAFTYALVPGAGDWDNGLFNLDSNGTLTILATTDYEQRLIDSNRTPLLHTELNASFLDANYSANLYLTPQAQYPTWTIRVRTSDSVGASYEETVLIASLDRDDTIPVITFAGSQTGTQTVWTPVIYPVYDGSDNVDGNITHLVVLDDNLTTQQPGTYLLHHDVTDVAGNNATRLTYTLTVINQNPIDLNLTNALIEENLPVGTYIGNFSTTDPDDPDNNKSYAYDLINQPANLPLSLDLNGTLVTTAILDFEQVESYTITVRTTDQFGGSYNENFTIYVVDAFPPYVETGAANRSSISSYSLYGSVIDEGGISGILERGFMVAEKPIMGLSDEGSARIISTDQDNNFSAQFTTNRPGRTFYYRAYAITAESDYLGTESTFITPVIPTAGFWSDGIPMEGAPDWWVSSWFGSYYAPQDNQWIMHSELGWVYPSPSMEGGVWLWKDGLKWLWTDSERFPFLHSIEEDSWLYFYGNLEEKRLFYSYRAKKWIVVNNGVIEQNVNSSISTGDTDQPNESTPGVSNPDGVE